MNSSLLTAAQALLAQHDRMTVAGWEVEMSMIRVEVESLRAAVADAKASHAYVSTACDHGLHERCRKFCAVDCECPCHVELFPIPAVAEAKQQGPSDTERLDWLGYVGHGFVRGTDVSKWTIEAPREGIRTVREAIDAAMSAAPEGSAKG